MEFSSFGKRFTRPSGTRELMDDLGAAMSADEPVMMLGGGNPAHIPAVLQRLAGRLRELAGRPRELRRMLADYAAPEGELRFRESLAAMLQRELGWPLGPEHIALTSGSQSGFFLLFNLLAGRFDDGGFRRILLPLTPEYVGYTDLGLEDGLLTARRPAIETLPDRLFKYHVDFDALDIGPDIAALCVSRPCNPTGNVLTDAELGQLARAAAARNLPLIIDGAYGLPFPGIVFTDATPYWDENVILCMSLSKIGLPAVRTGIVIARPEIVAALGAMNAVLSLAVGSVGAVLLRDLVDSGELLQLSRDVIRPFYARRAEQAVAWLRDALQGVDYYLHRPEGAFFLWLWLPGLPVSSAELYQRLKQRRVFVLPGEHFFPGLAGEWPHRHECLRLSYAQDPEAVREGIRTLGEELRRLR
ncbi:MAG: valine--pyruvate transaminase [Gammaproteobacteria bacterium]|nr:MAG: valine--pyruvate transaminase [Gammaproteobacteria bacterium]